MRMLQRNKQKMKYALLIGEADEYALDADGNRIPLYVDAEGNVIYQMTGEKVLEYSEPFDFFANISMTKGGDSEALSYGIDTSNYDAVIVTAKDALPLRETSLIWWKNEVLYTDAEETVVDAKSADFRVVKVAETLNTTKYVLQAQVN